MFKNDSSNTRLDYNSASRTGTPKFSSISHVSPPIPKYADSYDRIANLNRNIPFTGVITPAAPALDGACDAPYALRTVVRVWWRPPPSPVSIFSAASRRSGEPGRVRLTHRRNNVQACKQLHLSSIHCFP